MKINIFGLLGFMVGSILVLSGCARYRARPLRRLESPIVHKKTIESSVSFVHQVFSKTDCREYLDRNVIAKGYQPVHIEFINNSKRQFNISNECFNFACCASPAEVARTVHTSTVGRAVGYGVAGVFIWPFIIPAIVDGIGSSEANSALDDDFAQKALPQQLVRPYSIVSGLLFVPTQDFHVDFTLTVTDVATGDLFVLSPRVPLLKV